jgi:hypothetical protein
MKGFRPATAVTGHHLPPSLQQTRIRRFIIVFYNRFVRFHLESRVALEVLTFCQLK